MIQWVLIGELFAILARATNRPELSGAIPKWFGMIGAFIEQGNVAASELNALKMQIQQMIIEKREPTQEEWDSLRSRSDSAHAAIQGANLDDEPEPDGD